MSTIPLHIYDIKSDGGHLNRASSGETDAWPFGHVIDFLTSRIPQSLPILRAVQLAPKDEGAFLITTPLPPLSTREPKEEVPEDMGIESVWTMAYVNRANHPGTEMWTFSSLEMWPLIDGYEQASQKPNIEPGKLFVPFPLDVCQFATRQLIAILSEIPTKSRNEEMTLLEQGENPYSPCIKAGNVHTRVASLLAQTSVILKSSPPYGKYLFRTGTDIHDSGEVSDLPPGFRWELIRQSDYAEVMAQNQLIRSTSTLDRLKGVAIKQENASSAEGPSRLVAFGFAGEDGSVRTLHVDPDFRRMGLAKAVVQRIISLGFCSPARTGPFAATGNVQEEHEGSHPLAFCGVLESNEGSIRTFKAIGGTWAWDVFWLWFDLHEAKKAYGIQ
ncbi:unnamed protein product [Clonostachys solani]|uniref:N-acetyltransferase domain-containing protein n=1 Tax=Clonostachys solani TaxID=160281 RepID=A0A9P0ENB8_9HYPO|nr:unnamed protein product [Clonostachys solani]